MVMRKWISNDEGLQNKLTGPLSQQPEGVLGQTVATPDSTKVLGLKWDPGEDVFLF